MSAAIRDGFYENPGDPFSVILCKRSSDKTSTEFTVMYVISRLIKLSSVTLS